MMPFWFSLIFKFLAIALVAICVGVWQDAIAGWAVACLGLALLHAMHVYQLARLERWLQAPSAENLPDPWGAWGVAFAAIYRALRYEARKRDEVVKELDLFTQADAVQSLRRRKPKQTLNSADQNIRLARFTRARS